MNDSKATHGPRPGGRTTRKESQDGPDTVERLIDAGRRLFAERGFDGTSVRAVTQEAGANLGAITYHFGTKENLYQATLARVFGPLQEGITRLVEAPLPAPDRLDLFVRAMFHHQTTHGDLPRFMAQEIVLGDRPSPEILKTVRIVVGGLARIMEEGQGEGTIVPGDPVLMALTVLSQPIYLSLMPRFLRRDDLRSAELPGPRGSAEDHVLALVRRGFVIPQEESE
jgi:AcrR family transcriptional regulator